MVYLMLKGGLEVLRFIELKKVWSCRETSEEGG